MPLLLTLEDINVTLSGVCCLSSACESSCCTTAGSLQGEEMMREEESGPVLSHRGKREQEMW